VRSIGLSPLISMNFSVVGAVSWNCWSLEMVKGRG
jgi:hypothetical protein